MHYLPCLKVQFTKDIAAYFAFVKCSSQFSVVASFFFINALPQNPQIAYEIRMTARKCFHSIRQMERQVNYSSRRQLIMLHNADIQL